MKSIRDGLICAAAIAVIIAGVSVWATCVIASRKIAELDTAAMVAQIVAGLQ